jgi:hypothetical protein
MLLDRRWPAGFIELPVPQGTEGDVGELCYHGRRP